MHLDDEQVQRLLHGELGSATSTVSEHLAACAVCEQRVADAAHEERRTLGLLGQLDHAAPAVAVETIAQRAGAGRFAWGRWAAGILLVLGAAGAAYAMPGSPVRDWIATALERFRSDPEPPGMLPPPPSAPDASGLVVSAGRELLIEFVSAPAAGHVRVTLTDGTNIEVRAVNGARATFTSDEERLVIDNVDPTTTFDIRIPRTAPRVEIRAGQARLFRKQGERITTDATPDAAGIYLLPGGSSRP